MYESELISKVEEGKEYKKEILEEFILKHHYHLYSKSIGRNIYLIQEGSSLKKRIPKL